MNAFVRKIAYDSGESVPVVVNTVIGLYFLYFLTDVVGMSPALAGAVFMVGRAWDGRKDICIKDARLMVKFTIKRAFCLFVF